MDAIVKVEGITKHYKEFTLDHVSFQVPRGMILGLIGENGAGKSTTISALLDLISLDRGSIEIFGQSHEKTAREAKARMGVIIDGLDPYLMYYPGDVEKIMSRMFPGRWDGQLFRNYMDRFKLPREKRIKDYSKGMRVKFNFAAALSHRPELMILDEATSGLDPVVRDEMLDVLRDFIQDEHRSVLLSSHIISDLEKVCDYVTFLHQGRLLLSEPKDELLDRYVLAKAPEQELRRLDPAAVIGLRAGRFGAEALILRSALPAGMAHQAATLEDIMLYHIKEGH